MICYKWQSELHELVENLAMLSELTKRELGECGLELTPDASAGFNRALRRCYDLSLRLYDWGDAGKLHKNDVHSGHILSLKNYELEERLSKVGKEVSLGCED